MPSCFRITPLVLVLWFSVSANSASILVDTLDDTLATDVCSLRAALASINAQEALYGCSAPSGLNDEIVFGELGGVIVLHGEQLEILQPVRLIGPGSDELEISGQGLTRVFLVMADAVISGVTVSNGSAVSGTFDNPPHGGGILNANDFASLLLEECRLIGNSAGFGGGLGVDAGEATVRGCLFADNSATVVGGGVWVDASLNERSGLYMGKEYGYMGYTRLDVSDTVIRGNHADFSGGGLAAGRGSYASTVPP